MKIEKFSDYENQEINEKFWQDIKYGLSKLGRYKAGGKILGKGKVTKQAQAEIEETLEKESNKLLKELHAKVKKECEGFPNNRNQGRFLRGVIMYGQFYDSLVAAANKKPGENGYMDPEVCNQIITDLRKIVKKHLDVDLAAVYSVTESQDAETKEEFRLLNEELDSINEEEIFKKLGQLKDRAMDKLFGAKKGSDATQKTTKGQSAKLQKTSGETNIQSDRMSTLQSNKLPLVLAGVGGALGALGWLAQTEWMKNFIIEWFGGDKIVTDTKEIVTNIDGGKPDSKGLVHWMSQINQAQGGGQIQTAGDVTKFIDNFGGAENMKGFFIGNGGGDPLQQVQLLQQACSGNPAASVWTIFTKAAGMAGTMKGGQNLFGISTQANFVGKTIKTEVTKTLVKGAGGAIAAKVAGIGKIMSGIGIALVAAGALVKLLRDKGQRQSRAKTLNDLLQSLQFVKVGEPGKTDNKPEDPNVVEISEKSLYPTMIKNLQALRGILLNQDNVKLEGEGKPGKIETGDTKPLIDKEPTVELDKEEKEEINQIQVDVETDRKKTYDDFLKELTNKWKASQEKAGKNTKPGEGTRERLKRQAKYKELVVDWQKSQEKDGKNTSPGQGTRNRLMRIAKEWAQSATPVKEHILTMSELLLEKDRLGKGANIEVTGQESYLTQAVQNTRKSLKSLQDEKDKGFGISVKFIDDILEKKMDSGTKQPVKDLYQEIYEYLYGSKTKTLSDLGVLYKKESVDVIAKASSRQVIAEKMARFSKRTMQFEGEGFYAGLGKFGDYVEEYNETLKQIMDYYKSQKNERLIHRFNQYKSL